MPEAREDIKAIYTAAIQAVNPATAVASHMRRERNMLVLSPRGEAEKIINLDAYERVVLVGAGKATAAMARAAEEIIGDRLSGGIVCVKYGYLAPLSRTEILEAGHPYPDEAGVAAAKRIRLLLEQCTERDLVISLISGGGSSLLPLPTPPITLEEKRETTALLLKSGASIHEINAVRKHLSLVKGGNLARAAYPATVVNLMISDVVGDATDVIASGPFVPDRSTFADAVQVLAKYGILEKVPPSVRDRLERGARGEIEENPDSESEVFERVSNIIVASNIIALEAARREALDRGYHAIILSSAIEGDTKDAAFWHSRIAREVMLSGHPIPAPACVISGGETTVKVMGDGMGGRNMEFALWAAYYIDGCDRITVASVGTDGTDGPTDAAGAVVDGGTVRRARERGIQIEDYATRNDSYHFHELTGGLVITGPTNTNVMDVRIMTIV